MIIKCKYCGKEINRAKLIGFSLICPMCGKPQNGRDHSKLDNNLLAKKRVGGK